MEWSAASSFSASPLVQILPNEPVVLTVATMGLFSCLMIPTISALVWATKGMMAEKDRQIQRLEKDRDNEALRRKEADDRMDVALLTVQKGNETAAKQESTITILTEQIRRLEDELKRSGR